ncbi:ribose-phosphate pyrophosphokinase [Candidatus Bathyarchaeota archaeon]|nr:MAG: ribose-phosphate pyrophosphokinase [Candidatus Bathyarchaeota archaeon]
MRVVGGPSSTDLARKVSEVLQLQMVKTRTKRFPDGEFYFKFEDDIRGEDLLVVQSLYPPQDKHLMELFIILHTCRDLGAREIIAFIPYLAYSRQDKRYLKGECLSSAVVSEILQKLGVSTLYTVDVHNEDVLKKYKIPTFNLTASPAIAKYISGKGLNRPFVVAPDSEELAIKRAEAAARAIGAQYDYFVKRRNRHTGEIETFTKSMDVEGRDVIIIDDIISTGKTAANAASILKGLGARKVYVGVTHALMMGNAAEILQEAGVEEVIGTDSVSNRFAKVSVAPVLAEAVKNR